MKYFVYRFSINNHLHVVFIRNTRCRDVISMTIGSRQLSVWILLSILGKYIDVINAITFFMLRSPCIFEHFCCSVMMLLHIILNMISKETIFVIIPMVRVVITTFRTERNISAKMLQMPVFSI